MEVLGGILGCQQWRRVCAIRAMLGPALPVGLHGHMHRHQALLHRRPCEKLKSRTALICCTPLCSSWRE